MIQSIYDEITIERNYQIKKWGNANDDTKNSPWHWVTYIISYASRWQAGEWAPLSYRTCKSFRACMITVAAIAVAAVESYDRQNLANGKQFYE